MANTTVIYQGIQYTAGGRAVTSRYYVRQLDRHTYIARHVLGGRTVRTEFFARYESAAVAAAQWQLLAPREHGA